MRRDFSWFRWLFSWLLVLVAVGQIGINVGRITRERPLLDFSVYYEATGAWIGGENPYSQVYALPWGEIPFNYPPGFLLVFAPWMLLPFSVAQASWVLLTFITFGLVFYLLRRLIREKIPKWQFLLVLALLIQTFPFKFTVSLGQVNSLALLLVVGAVYFYAKGQKWLSAFFLAVAGTLKLFPLGLLPLFWLKKDFKYGGAVLLAFGLINGLFLGLAREYFGENLPGLLRMVGWPSFYDQSILAWLVRLTGQPGLAKWLHRGLVLGLYGGLLWLVRRRSLVEAAAVILAFLAIAGSFAWQHHLIFVYPLIFLYYRKWQLFLPIWLVLVWHFKEETSRWLSNPWMASYQTLLVLALVAGAVLMGRKRVQVARGK